jgi:hypothetical protein
LKDILKEILYKSTIRANTKGWQIDIDLPFLLALWEQQDGKCYYTQKYLSLEINNPNKVSIDRVDSSGGYTKNNVVLCRVIINNLKQDLSLKDFKELITEIHQGFENNGQA